MSGYTAGPSSVRAGLTVSGLCSHFIFIPEWIKYKVKLNTASKTRREFNHLYSALMQIHFCFGENGCHNDFGILLRLYSKCKYHL